MMYFVLYYMCLLRAPAAAIYRICSWKSKYRAHYCVPLPLLYTEFAVGIVNIDRIATLARSNSIDSDTPERDKCAGETNRVWCGHPGH